LTNIILRTLYLRV